MRAHDLLWLNRPLRECLPDVPEWADPCWPVVVRRAIAPSGQTVPVGVRGLARHQRHAGWLDIGRVARVVTPETLARNHIPAKGDPAHATTHPPACIETLTRIAPMLDETGLAWGPTGAVGFWLACGAPVLHAGSDLDLVVHAPRPLPADVIGLLQALPSHAGCRLDIQIETGRGAFALAEWLAGRPRILLKTAAGPLLVANPWETREQAAGTCAAPDTHPVSPGAR
ncbi:MAG: malonate decarboxylase holo-ACP synthase [Lautropia sp.]|nr:malonate decarboxylase holo-ACP synthase [Lautropia sp.]